MQRGLKWLRISFFLAMLGGLSQLALSLRVAGALLMGRQPCEVCAYIACNLTKMWPEADG